MTGSELKRSQSIKQHFEEKYRAEGYVIWDGISIPKIGMMARRQTVGFKEGGWMLRVSCPKCGDEHWVWRKSNTPLCSACAKKKAGLIYRGNKHPNWRGGRRVENEYVILCLSPDSLYVPMAKKVRHNSFLILEHRLVMAQYLGRLLESWEIVHHINGNKTDNRVENLQLLPNKSEHSSYTLMQRRIKELESRVTILEARNVLLKLQVEEEIKC